MPDAFNWSTTVSRMQAASRVFMTTHQRPDGDAIGCVVALTLALRSAGKTVTPVLLTAPAPRFDFLQTDDFAGRLGVWNEDCVARIEQADLALVVDTASRAQLEPATAHLERHPNLLVLDHHATADLSSHLAAIDASAGAAGVLALELIEAAEWPVTRAIAEALMTAITSDTGWFRYSNADARALRAAARLLDCGIDSAALYQRLYMQDTPARARLIGRVLQRMQLHAGGRLAVSSLALSDFAEYNAQSSDSEGVLDSMNYIGTVVASALCTETPDGVIRVNLRSKRDVDVSQVAQQFGGGGHVRASGCRLTATLDDAVERITSAMLTSLNGATLEPEVSVTAG